MKKWKGKLGFIVALLAVLMILLSLMSCHERYDTSACDEEDSSVVCTNELTQVMFSTVSDFQLEQVKLQSNEMIKEVFLKMSPQMIERVSKVVLSKNQSATIEDLVTEYKVNYDIYSRQIDDDETPPKKSTIDNYTPLDTSNLKIEKHEQTSVNDRLLRE